MTDGRKATRKLAGKRHAHGLSGEPAIAAASAATAAEGCNETDEGGRREDGEGSGAPPAGDGARPTEMEGEAGREGTTGEGGLDGSQECEKEGGLLGGLPPTLTGMPPTDSNGGKENSCAVEGSRDTWDNDNDVSSSLAFLVRRLRQGS